ncbi:hypothetical protein HYX12_03710 [Candidatus Woesearchaeota archaeon]|nr:hypothetical protein [Candidatus Woesearchaeota archaeon]
MKEKEHIKLAKKGLEETLKEKVSPLLEETMEKSWGITIPQIESDITDRLRNSSLNIYVSPHLNFLQAKKKFKEEFLKKSLRMHLGNISQLAKTLRIDRRSVHRAIKSLEINVEKLRTNDLKNYREQEIDQTIRSSLAHYGELIQPQQMEKLYSEVPGLSKNIVKILPLQEITWKEAERDFERQFISHVLKETNKDFIASATKLKIRVETLYRKVKTLGL